MSWIYEQTTGRMSKEGALLTIGYSGYAGGKNNPDMQDVHDVGPIPRGFYTIGAPSDTVTHGPYVLPLTPDAGNDMQSRSGFLIHGDSVIEPGTASHGCIIMPRFARERIRESHDSVLQVTL